MPSFAVIAEGVTDQIVIDAILSEICGDRFDDEIDVNFLQPLRDVSDAFTAPHGGWELVFEYCKVGIGDAAAANDFVVIHLDSDCGEHENFGLALTEGGGDRNLDEIIADACGILEAKIGAGVLAEHSAKIIFAIAVHSTECWLLQILFDIEREKSCRDRLSAEMRRADDIPLVKDARTYGALARRVKKKRLNALKASPSSLGKFIRNVQAVCP